MSETRILIRLWQMYIPWNWEFVSAFSKLRNFGGGGVETPNPPPTGYASAHINPLSGQHTAVSQKGWTVINKVQSFIVVFVYETTNLNSISAVMKLFCDGCLLSLVAYVTFYCILYTFYIDIYITSLSWKETHEDKTCWKEERHV
jgi:hypothetical protein